MTDAEHIQLLTDKTIALAQTQQLQMQVIQQLDARIKVLEYAIAMFCDDPTLVKRRGIGSCEC